MLGLSGKEDLSQAGPPRLLGSPSARAFSSKHDPGSSSGATGHGHSPGVHTGGGAWTENRGAHGRWGMVMILGCSWEVALQGQAGLSERRRQGGKCEERPHLLPR